MRIIGLVIIFVLLLMGVMNGGSLGNVIDVPSVLIVVGLTLGFGLQGKIPFGMMMKSFFGGAVQGDDLRLVVLGWQHLRTYVMVSGVLGTFCGHDQYVSCFRRL